MGFRETVVWQIYHFFNDEKALRKAIKDLPPGTPKDVVYNKLAQNRGQAKSHEISHINHGGLKHS